MLRDLGVSAEPHRNERRRNYHFGTTLEVHAGFAPGFPHLANFPFASLQRPGLTAGAGGHFTNLVATSRQGAAKAGAELTTKRRKGHKELRIVRLVRILALKVSGAKAMLLHYSSSGESLFNIPEAARSPFSGHRHEVTVSLMLVGPLERAWQLLGVVGSQGNSTRCRLPHPDGSISDRSLGQA